MPEILDTFTGDCNAEEPFTFRKVLNFRNDKLEQARNQIAEKEKKENKNKRTSQSNEEQTAESKPKKNIIKD